MSGGNQGEREKGILLRCELRGVYMWKKLRQRLAVYFDFID